MPTFDEIKGAIADKFREHPIEAIGAAAALMAGISKVIDSMSSAQNARTWKREVRRRERKSR